MHYQIQRTTPFKLKLSDNEKNLLIDETIGGCLHHLEGDFYFLAMNDEGFDEEALKPFLSKSLQKVTFSVHVVDFDSNLSTDIWTFSFGTGYFEMIN